MNKITLFACLFFFSLYPLQAVDKPFGVSIVPKDRSEHLSFISWASGSNQTFFVVLVNLTDRPQPVFERSNSWGHQSLFFYMTLSDGRKITITVRPSVFTRNLPTTYVVPPHSYEVCPIIFNDDWIGNPNPGFGKPGDTKVTLKAIYKIPPSQEADKKGVWVGQIESESIEVDVHHW
jgi:hypothetical protein